MKFFGYGLAAALALLLSSPAFTAEKVRLEGAELGQWTMDLDAARKLAADSGVPMFLDFTGSDWCGWCIRMQKQVFEKPGWQKFAAEKLALVVIDFPRHEETVPEKYRSRNRSLQRKYGVSGYPTYIILDADGSTLLGRLGAGRNKTPESFIAEVEGVLANSQSGINAIKKELPPEQADAYQKVTEKLRREQEDLDNWISGDPEQSEENFKKYYAHLDRLTALQEQKEDLESIPRLAKMTPEQAKEFQATQTQLRQTKAELEAWMRKGIANSPENQEKLQSMQRTIEELSTKLASL